MRHVKADSGRILAIILCALVFLSLLSPFVIFTLNEHIVGGRISNTGEQNLLIIPVFFTDMYPSTTLEEIRQTMVQANAYVRELSYGRTWLVADILGWTQLDQTAEYYGVPATIPCGGDKLGEGDSYRLNQMVNDAIAKVDPNVDFRLYNRLLIFHAGYGKQSENSSGDQSRDKWVDTCDMTISHLTDESVVVESAMVVAEFEGNNGWLGAFVHELGHEFGAKDLYNPEYGPDIGNWCLMSSGNWLNDSGTPCHMCAYTKLSIGYLDENQVVPISNGTYRFELVAMSVKAEGFYAARFNLDKQGRLYYLLEARKQTGFDSALEHSGVLVTLINTTAPDSQHGEVLLAPDPRYPNEVRSYGVGEFFLDLESGFGLRVINTTETGYDVQVTTKAQSGWVRTSIIEQGLDLSRGGSMIVLGNGTLYLAVQGLNSTSGFNQVDVHKSEDGGVSWKVVFSTPPTVHRMNPVLVARHEYVFRGPTWGYEDRPYLFCEAEFSVNHTIEAWDITSHLSYNLTEGDWDARKASVVATDDSFYLAYEIENMTSPLWGQGVFRVGLSRGYILPSLRYPSRILENASSPSLSPMPSGSASPVEPYLAYLSGRNASHQNEVWLDSFSLSAQSIHFRLYSGLSNVSSPAIAVNNEMNVIMVAMENWTYLLPESFRSDGMYVVASVIHGDVTIQKVGKVEATDPIRSPPLVGWGKTPTGDDAFYLACNNGTTCCTLCFYPSLQTEKTESYRWGIPLPHVFSTHMQSKRWVNPLICDIESYQVYVWSFSLYETAYYSYRPVYVRYQVASGTFTNLVILISVSIVSTVSLVTLVLAGRKSKMIQESSLRLRESWKYPVVLTIILVIAFLANYLFASVFCSPAVLCVNLGLEIAFVILVSSWLYDVLWNPPERTEDEAPALPESADVQGSKVTKEAARSFLIASFDEKKLAKLESAANLWFLGYETMSLAIAIIQIESLALQTNLGLLNFVVSGILYFAFQLTAHYDRIDLSISIYTYLRWYTFMLLSALVTVSALYGMWISDMLDIRRLAIQGQIATLIVLGAIAFLAFYAITRRVDRGFYQGLRNMLREGSDKQAIEAATVFSPTGVLPLLILFLFNLSVFLATLSGRPFYVAFLTGVTDQLATWFVLLILLCIALYITYRKSLNAQRRMLSKVG